jgi:hypothetical protein
VDAYVAQAGGSEQGVRDGVDEDVRVRMAKKPLLEGYVYPARISFLPSTSRWTS